MGEYFKPMRRKIGVLTLVMACVLMVGWIRSPFTQHTFTFRYLSPSCIKVVSVSNHLIFATLFVRTLDPMPITIWSSEEVKPNKWVMTFANLPVMCPIKDRPFSVGDIEFRIGNLPVSLNWYQFPYWSIVLPLTVLSAYLLLSMPRRSTPKKTDEPVLIESWVSFFMDGVG